MNDVLERGQRLVRGCISVSSTSRQSHHVERLVQLPVPAGVQPGSFTMTLLTAGGFSSGRRELFGRAANLLKGLVRGEDVIPGHRRTRVRLEELEGDMARCSVRTQKPKGPNPF